MTKFSTSGFVHPVYCLSHRAEKTRAERERNNRASVRERVQRTDGRKTNAKRNTPKRVRVLGKKKISKIFKMQQKRVYTHLLKERARKGSRPNKQSEQKRRRNKRVVPGEGVKFHKLRASPTFGPCSAIFFFSHKTTTRGFVWKRMRKKNKRIRFV